MTAFFRRAEEILQLATNTASELGDTLVVLDRQGGFRMLDPAGWSLPALAAEFGAEAVYKVERQGLWVRVEGWNGSQRCLFQGQTSADRAHSLLGGPFALQAKRFSVPLLRSLDRKIAPREEGIRILPSEPARTHRMTPATL